MDLWWDLFAATRHERVETGRRIARNAGLPPVNDYIMGALIAQCEERDAAGRANMPGALATITHPAPPDNEYLVAKMAAEEYLRSPQPLVAELGYTPPPVAIPAAA